MAEQEFPYVECCARPPRNALQIEMDLPCSSYIHIVSKANREIEIIDLLHRENHAEWWLSDRDDEPYLPASSHLVCNGQEPVPVPDSVIAALRGREDAEGLVCLPPQPLFVAGEKVRLLDGAFADCIGLFEGMKDIERVSVLLDLLGRKVRVLLDVDSVAAA